jgi:hypothetical protein
MKKHIAPYLMVITFLLLNLFSLEGADIKLTATKVVDKSHKAVVTIRVVIKLKQSYGGQTRDQEQKLEVTGTVIDPSGLTVTSAASVDPTTMYRTLMAQSGGQMKMESEIKETTLIMDDGTEVDADIVLKDTNLDMAFIKPREVAQPFEAVALSPAGKSPAILDSILVVGRLGKIGNRVNTVSVGAIVAFVKGPRNFYVCDNNISSFLGSIAYDEEGLPIGIFLLKTNPDVSDGFMNLVRGRGADMMMPVLRPVADLIEIAEQARQAKVVESKATTP